MTDEGRGVAPPRPHALEAVFGRRRVAIGVVHCAALPGSPRYSGSTLDEISNRAVGDALAYADGGLHGLIVENHGDIPFSKPEDIGQETAASMAVIAERLRREVGLPVGINVLANGAMTALAVAKASGARFIRVNEWANAYIANEGLIEGPAAKAARYRAWLKAHEVAIFADVHVKHGAHAIVSDRGITELTRDVEFFDADAVIVTGRRTGDSTTTQEVREVRAATSLPLLIGSGVTKEDVSSLLTLADGVIIGSSLKHGGVWWNTVDRERVHAFMDAFTGTPQVP